MIPNEKHTALATQCLWSLQEATTEIEGLLLTHVDGLAWTTTFQGDESTERLAAVSTALFLLGEEASEAWGHGETREIFLKLKMDDEEAIQRQVVMRPIGYDAILVVVCQTDSISSQIYDFIDKAEGYIYSVLSGENPPLPIWFDD